ncbi:SAM-dependent methyltransferase [Streptomyces malaysiensis]|uniref:SAM-dependent methyltransferase n=1 Tax=Streptomyces TaxID=1883 RepID=UPI0036262FB9
MPAKPNPHEVARSVAPDARIVHVDNDPIGSGSITPIPRSASVALRRGEPTKLHCSVAIVSMWATRRRPE